MDEDIKKEILKEQEALLRSKIDSYLQIVGLLGEIKTLYGNISVSKAEKHAWDLVEHIYSLEDEEMTLEQEFNMTAFNQVQEQMIQEQMQMLSDALDKEE